MTDGDMNRVTDSARQALAMHLQDESERLIRLAKVKKAEAGEIGPVNVADLIAVLPTDRYSSDDKVMFDNLLVRQQERRSRLARVLHIYSIFGVLIAIFGLGYALFVQFGPNLDPRTTVGFAAAATGLSIAAISYYAASEFLLRKNTSTPRMTRPPLDPADDISAKSIFIDEWSMLEKGLRRRAREFMQVDQFGIIDMIATLISHGVIDSDDAEIIQTSLSIRNRLVHDYDAEFSQSTLFRVANDLRYLRAKLGASGSSSTDRSPY
ncbi:hypothetical protein [Rhodococcus sp. MEB032]|uniref:hypothetical protein n=1 Tax=Rhodococcus sp. MEB032 TaxID=3040322 RepID=UPI00254E68DD|nr:hypothetical protein [Rhodococcus sp. MEB032]